MPDPKKWSEIMFNRILVPLDGSPLAERALPHAEQFARIFGASIVLLQVLEPASYHENPKAVDPLSWQIRKAEAELYMQGIAARTRENLGENILLETGEQKSRVDYCIREGKTAENIVDFAHAENIDLLVISTHGSGGLSRWNISSVTQKVINLVYLHVLIVRAYQHPAVEETNIHYRRILLPIDSSRRAESSLSAGIALVRGETLLKNAVEEKNPTPGPLTENPRLVLAAVIKPPEIPLPKPYPLEIGQLSEELMQVSRKAVNNYLSEMKERLPVESEIRLVENDGIPSAIQELAGEDGIDLVVLSAHGYTGQFIWPYGTVTRNYLEHGNKPVLVLQDVPRSQVLPTAAQIAAEKSGRR
jgi:nucleotide-binding universal stress UspA family protein